MSESLRARFRRLEPLLDRALELEGAERAAYVDACARAHPDLADHLRRALDAEQSTLPGLGALAAEAVRRDSTNRHNLRVGPWRLLERIGRGGMGTVYRAERADGAFDKQVAVKLLRGGDHLRFKQELERERQVLARLEHPAIARLLDGGVLPDGHPWLVMELAEGRDLAEWCREERPSLARRLAVFLQVCAAVGHAHSHLVVHRDLKPGNLRVDAGDRAKLLDFGIAKLLDREGAEASTRNLALTPEFAAPEQLDRGTVTTRTDLYALGALLYLLLAGRAPHPNFDGNWPEFIARVTGSDPPPPSAVTGAAGLPPRLLRGDLDAIVLRALCRDPAGRYASAEALAEDVRRHLDGRPVRARAGGWWYAFTRWFQRNWLAAGLGLALFLLLATATVLLALTAQRLAQERDAALRAAAEADAARIRAAGAMDVRNATPAAYPGENTGKDDSR